MIRKMKLEDLTVNVALRGILADNLVTVVSVKWFGDADVLRAGGTARALGGTVKAPSTPRLREGRLWAPSCAASGGATSANWTG